MKYGEDLTLFDSSTPPVRVPLRQLPPGPPTWSRYSLKRRVRCDDCMLLLLQAKGEGPAARIANHRRVSGPTELLLCDAHAQVRRDQDE